MTTRLRTAILALTATVGLVLAPVAFATSASASTTTGSNVLFFSNDTYTDPSEEDATMIAGLEAAGATVTTFDGGDGSAAAWSAALTNHQVLVIPESSSIWASGGTPVMSDEAAAVVLAFTQAGGTVILGGSCNPELLSYLTGLDYFSVWNTGGGGGPWALQIVDPTLPTEMTYSDGTYPVVGISTWSSELLAGVTPIYGDEIADELAAGQFPVGAGFVYTLAYDWYPGTEGGDEAGRDGWNVLLGAIAVGTSVDPVPVPVLAETGSTTDPLTWMVAAGVLLLGAAGLIVARTRKA